MWCVRLLLLICTAASAQSPPQSAGPREAHEHQLDHRAAARQAGADNKNDAKANPIEVVAPEKELKTTDLDQVNWWIVGPGIALVIIGLGYIPAYYRQAYAAESQRDILFNTERARIDVVPKAPHTRQEFQPPGLINSGVGFEWHATNVGKTPAIICKIGARFDAVDSISDLPPEPDIDVLGLAQPTEAYPNGISVAPGNSIRRFTMFIHGRAHEVAKSGKIMIVYGVVKYRLTITAKSSHETRFCYIWNPNAIDPFVPSPLPEKYTQQT